MQGRGSVTGSTGTGRLTAMRLRKPAAIVVATLLLLPGGASAWSYRGHRLVGELAWRLLTPEAARSVERLLAAESPPYDSLAGVAVWADDVKRDPGWEWSAPHHYVNIPDAARSVVLERDCALPRSCVVRAIMDAENVLGDAGRSFRERRQALKFLTHFVGDVHQPLHVSRASDRGGNEIGVRFFGEEDQLHSVWDREILDRGTQRWFSFLEPEEFWLARVADDLELSRAEAAGWSRGNAMSWAQESLELAFSNAYVIGPDGALEEPYFERNLPVVLERVRMAAARLAWRLNELLG